MQGKKVSARGFLGQGFFLTVGLHRESSPCRSLGAAPPMAGARAPRMSPSAAPPPSLCSQGPGDSAKGLSSGPETSTLSAKAKVDVSYHGK